MEYAEDIGGISEFRPSNTWPFSVIEKQKEN